MTIPAKKTLLFALLASLTGSTALATPVAVGLSDFGTATSISFAGFVNNTLITTQFLGQGLTVSGGFYEDVGGSSGVIFGAPAADNFSPSSPGPGPYNVITFTFSTPMAVVGMNKISNPGSFNITDVNGLVAYSSSLTPGFAGFYDPAGFTSVTITVTGAVNNAFGIDSLLFGSTVTPEPNSASLFLCSLLMLACIKLFSWRPASWRR
jgi:hypothetical protein